MNWQPLTSQTDLDGLISLFGGFHDGCLREAHLWSGNSVSPDLSMSVDPVFRVRLLIQRQFTSPSAIELLFEQVMTFHLQNYPFGDSIISEATLLHRDGLFYWADRHSWSPQDADRNDATWISGEILSWRDASEWMGHDLRFGPDRESPFKAAHEPPNP